MRNDTGNLVSSILNGLYNNENNTIHNKQEGPTYAILQMNDAPKGVSHKTIPEITWNANLNVHAARIERQM